MFFATAISHLLQIKSKSSIKWQTISLTKQTVKKHKQQIPTLKWNSSKVGQQVIWINLGMAESGLQTTSLSKKHQEIFPKPTPRPLPPPPLFFFLRVLQVLGWSVRSQKAEIQKQTQQSVLDKN